MRTPRSVRFLFAVVVGVALLAPAFPGPAASNTAFAAPQAQRPIELQDIADWKRINAATLSNDGAWLAYRLAPAEGNGEIIARRTEGDTEYRFEAGSGGGGLSLSDDSRWLAFTIYPEFRRGGRGGGNGNPPRNKMGLLDLTSGEMTEFEEVRSYAFSGDNAQWLAMHKYAAGGAGAAAQGGRGRGRRRWR